MLLAREVDLPLTASDLSTLSPLLDALIPPNTPPYPDPRLSLARQYIEKAALLNFPSAQYKLGHSFENATLSCPFDPLLSVHWYLLSSQNGQPEADMGLSKWFLCGSDSFKPDEGLSFLFAEKAARKGLPEAAFALGYYYEVGVGKQRDLDKARRWYEKVCLSHLRNSFLIIRASIETEG
jgi:TPR repeat protein